MVRTLLGILNKRKIQVEPKKCYYCGNSTNLTYNAMTNTYTCKHCSAIINNTKKELVAC